MRNRFWHITLAGAVLFVSSNGTAQLTKPEAPVPSAAAAEVKPATPPPTLADRRLAKARILADLMAPAEATIDSTVTNVSIGFRLGFEGSPGNRKLIADYPGLDDAIVLAMKPRVLQLVQSEREPTQAATSNLLVEYFSTAELDQGIRFFRHPVMIKFVRNTIVNAKLDATTSHLRAQMAKGNTDPKVSEAAIKRDAAQSVRRTTAQLTQVELRSLAPFMQTEFVEKFQRVRPLIDRGVLELSKAGVARMSGDEELQTLAIATMAEYIAKADAAKAATAAQPSSAAAK